MAAPTLVDENQSPQQEDGASALFMVIMGQGVSSIHRLPERGTLEIGRAEEAPLRILDPLASRNHARLLVEPGQVNIEDLGSANGTSVGDRPVAPGQPVPLAAGEAVLIGSTLLVLQRRAPPRPQRRASTHEAFETRLIEECARAENQRATFALLRLSTAPSSGSSGSSGVEACVLDALRPGDLLALYGPGEYEVLLPDSGRPQSEAMAGAIVERLRAIGAQTDLALAFYPTDGTSPQELLSRVSAGVRGRNGRAASAGPAAVPADGFVLVNQAMKDLYAVCDRIAAGTINVLILGETGVGKEALAQALHRRSPRASHPFVGINCAALSDSLLESELFGHEKGAFTGATSSKAGLLEAAEGGTVFLDEVAEMSLALQAKLLRALESKQILRVGGTRPRAIDVRFLSATNREIEEELEGKTFRQDLYFRLNGVTLVVPSLRDRRDEIRAAGLLLHPVRGRQPGASRAAVDRAGTGGAGHLFLARQRAGAPERGRTSGPAGQRRRDHGRPPAHGQDVPSGPGRHARQRGGDSRLAPGKARARAARDPGRPRSLRWQPDPRGRVAGDVPPHALQPPAQLRYPAAARGRGLTGAGSMPGQSGATLLVVDDNADNRDLLARRLEKRGYQVRLACDGAEALAAVAASGIDLVLLDVMMPGLSGLEVLRRVRQTHSEIELPVVMATARSDSEDVVEALSLGANDYVTKPLDFPVVLARIETLLRTRGAFRLAASSGRLVPAPGLALAGRYRLEQPIGSGAFGTVWKALHLELDRPVAVKVLRTELDLSPAAVARFRREGVSACRIKHPSAVSVFDFGVTPEGVAYLVMELLEGRSLHDELMAAGALSGRAGAETAVAACSALQAAHDAGVIHRDVKPSNIFLQRVASGWRVKVLDFGVAKIAGDVALASGLTVEGSLLGTPAYMAPERLAGQPYDGRSDVYSLGVTLYEALTGRLPFVAAGEDLSTLVAMQINDPPAPLRAWRPGLSPDSGRFGARGPAQAPGRPAHRRRAGTPPAGRARPGGRRVLGHGTEQRRCGRAAAGQRRIGDPEADLRPLTAGRAAAQPGRTSIACIFATRRGKSTGLVSYSSQPASRAACSSPDMAWAVRAMTGIARVPGSAFSRRVTSQPSRSGRLMSIRTRSGGSSRTLWSAASPPAAVTTVYPLRASRRDSMSRLISLSSTSRTLVKRARG